MDNGAFGELRERWRDLVRREREAVERERGVIPKGQPSPNVHRHGEAVVAEQDLEAELNVPAETETELALAERLKNSAEAVHLRSECTMRVREEVLKLRRARGWPDEDPKARLVDTWKAEGKGGMKREGKMEDGSWVKDT